MEIYTLLAAEAVIQCIRGFKEGETRCAKMRICSKCHSENILLGDGKCVKCHKTGSGQSYSYFRGKDSASIVNERDFIKGKSKDTFSQKVDLR